MKKSRICYLEDSEEYIMKSYELSKNIMAHELMIHTYRQQQGATQYRITKLLEFISNKKTCDTSQIVFFI